jgi:hypothetical protein
MAKQYREPVDDGVNEHARSLMDLDARCDEPLESGVVARGRTLLVPEPGSRRVVGFTKEGLPVERPKLKELREGDPITDTKSEIERFRGLGFVFDPKKVASDAEAEKLDKNGNPVPGGDGGVGFVKAGQPV